MMQTPSRHTDPFHIVFLDEEQAGYGWVVCLQKVMPMQRKPQARPSLHRREILLIHRPEGWSCIPRFVLSQERPFSPSTHPLGELFERLLQQKRRDAAHTQAEHVLLLYLPDATIEERSQMESL